MSFLEGSGYYLGGDGYPLGGDGYMLGGDGYALGGDGYALGGYAKGYKLTPAEKRELKAASAYGKVKAAKSRGKKPTEKLIKLAMGYAPKKKTKTKTKTKTVKKVKKTMNPKMTEKQKKEYKKIIAQLLKDTNKTLEARKRIAYGILGITPSGMHHIKGRLSVPLRAHHKAKLHAVSKDKKKYDELHRALASIGLGYQI